MFENPQAPETCIDYNIYTPNDSFFVAKTH